MKKLMTAAAIVCAAIASQAAVVNWTSTTAPCFFDTASIAGNGSYSVNTATMKASGYTFSYILAVTDVATTESKTVSYNVFTGAFANNGITVGSAAGDIAQGTSYDYIITITTELSDLGKIGEWDYSKAVATTTLSGTFTGATGTSTLSSVVPTTWTVSGAQAIPEPTSGLLLLLGVAGLALRRKQK